LAVVINVFFGTLGTVFPEFLYWSRVGEVVGIGNKMGGGGELAKDLMLEPLASPDQLHQQRFFAN
jgi:hypothetical protein